MSGWSAAEVVAIIPARGGSKGVPGKNLARVGGVPLVLRTVRAALAAGIGSVVVTTDDDAIGAVAAAAGAEVVERPADLAGDTASSESALLHALAVLAERGTTPRVVAFLQATSPFLEPGALARAVTRVLAGEADSVLAAVPTYEFLWRTASDGTAVGVNHDRAVRPRRQDREAHHRETGAFYVLDAAGFRECGHRFFGRTVLEEVAPERALEIDSPAELEIARRLAPLLDERPRSIDVDAVVTDFDGVHTDDTALVTTDGTEAVRVSRADGLGVQRLVRAGVPVLILSREADGVVARRAAKLGVPVLHGVEDKVSALAAWCAERRIDPARVLYVGNDVNDSGALRYVGWPVVVPDARDEVLALARLVLTETGGRGAVREVAELVLAGWKERTGR